MDLATPYRGDNLVRGAWKMKTLPVLIFILWGLPGVSQALSIPPQNTALTEGEPEVLRQKRENNGSLSCAEHQYKPRGKDYCCHKCHAGYKVTKDCAGVGQSSNCEFCDAGRFADVPNGSNRCERCTECLTQRDQIVVSECTRNKDTQCGCADGYYIQRHEGDFTCQECSQCQNGTEIVKCHHEQDTVCRCKRDFFLDSQKTCRPCEACDDTDCRHECPQAAVKPEAYNEGLWIAVGAAILAAVLAVVAVFGVYYHYRRKATSGSSDSSGSITQSDPLINNNNNNDGIVTTKLNYLPGQPNRAVDTSCDLQHEDMQTTPLPLPDITRTAPPRLHSTEVMYGIIRCVPVKHWKEFARRLGLSDHDIDSCEHDYRHYKESQFAMLKAWMSGEESATVKRDQLYRVLREMHLGGCIEQIEEYF